MIFYFEKRFLSSFFFFFFFLKRDDWFDLFQEKWGKAWLNALSLFCLFFSFFSFFLFFFLETKDADDDFWKMDKAWPNTAIWQSMRIFWENLWHNHFLEWKKEPKLSPKTQNKSIWSWLGLVPIGTLRVSISTWAVSIGNLRVLISTLGCRLAHPILPWF